MTSQSEGPIEFNTTATTAVSFKTGPEVILIFYTVYAHYQHDAAPFCGTPGPSVMRKGDSLCGHFL